MRDFGKGLTSRTFSPLGKASRCYGLSVSNKIPCCDFFLVLKSGWRKPEGTNGRRKKRRKEGTREGGKRKTIKLRAQVKINY